MNEFPTTQEERLYNDLAWTWPIISPKEDYVEETEDFCRMVKAYGQGELRRVLNMGCGGGHNDWTMKTHFEVTGIDINDKMLDLARALNPECKYIHGDMRNTRLGESFDMVVVFDSLAHMISETELQQAFETAHANLRPGGLFCTWREFAPERFIQNETKISNRNSGDTEIVLVENYYDTDPEDGNFEAMMIFIIRQEGKLRVERDIGKIGLFPLSIWKGTLRSARLQLLETSEDEIGGDFFICRRGN